MFDLDAIRRAFSRSEWGARLLRWPASTEPGDAPGLLMIQIDGLSRTQLNKALANGEMPFVQRLIQRGEHRLHNLYSGVPSTTPAVQAELFYGVRTAVPAFGFISKDSGEEVRMLDSEPAAEVERTLATQGRGLLERGAAYADIFDGGAPRAHFCSSRLRWDDLMRWRNVAGFAFLLVTNLWSFVRAAMLLVMECGLAVADCMDGIFSGRDFAKEVAFVPSRVAVCVLLREFVRIGAEMDAARGVPVVHLNLLGYDEQAHRRGPSSAFAHWSLAGIDECVRRLHGAARRSLRRRYSLVVYSDHGQEEALPYSKAYGRSIEAAVAAVFDGNERLQRQRPRRAYGEQRARARWLLSEQWLDAISSRFGPDPGSSRPSARVVAMGPVGFVYCERQPASAERGVLACALVRDANVPLVLARDDDEEVCAWTATGEYRLPRDAPKLFGAGHPHLADVGEDMAALCRHRDAGDFVICGYRASGPHISFPLENGAHGGPGHEETRAFALLPAGLGDESLYGRERQTNGPDYLRPLDLRRAALSLLG
ncbi:MAG: alkaline phosphatase family protein [Gammaproteobacteria bacterium]